MKIIFILLFLLGIFPAFILLFLYIYKIFIDCKIKKFKESGNELLTWDKIKEIVIKRSPSDALRIFWSAIIDHSEIGGIVYYTKYPFGMNIIIAHDNHRKSLIIYKMGIMLEDNRIIYQNDLEMCSEMLIQMAESYKETHYTQLFIWDTLGKLAYIQRMKLVDKIGVETLKKYLAGGDYLRSIAIIKLIFHLLKLRDKDNIIKEFVDGIIIFAIENGNRTMLSLLVFKIQNCPFYSESQKKFFFSHLPKFDKFNKFIENLNNLNDGFLKEEVSEGLTNLGFQPPPYSKKNTEGEIIDILLKESLEDIYVPTAYIRYTFNLEKKREKFLDFLWFDSSGSK